MKEKAIADQGNGTRGPKGAKGDKGRGKGLEPGLHQQTPSQRRRSWPQPQGPESTQTGEREADQEGNGHQNCTVILSNPTDEVYFVDELQFGINVLTKYSHKSFKTETKVTMIESDNDHKRNHIAVKIVFNIRTYIRELSSRIV